jgi:single-strand DNA-binding protein
MGNGLTVTVVGWVATDPREIVGDGTPYTSFRMACTPRWFDSRSSTWTDGRTEWITVKAFRDVAMNVAGSVRKGDPLLAHGRLRTEEWSGESGPRTSLTLDVTALGHDLTRGRSQFVRRVHVGPGGTAAPTAEGDEEGATGADRSGEFEVDPWSTAEEPAGGPGEEIIGSGRESEPVAATP